MTLFADIAGVVKEPRRARGMSSLKRRIRRGFPLPGMVGAGRWRNPKLMIVQDRPHTGYMQGFFARQASKIYEGYLAEQGLSHEDIYVTSAIKTLPGVKASSAKQEALLWAPVLTEEYKLVKPEKVAFVGRIARDMMAQFRRNDGGTAHIPDAEKEA